jgi:hypothetical protein
MEAGNEKEECFQEFKAAAMRFHSTLYESVGLRLIVAGQSFQSVFDTISTYITKPLRNKPRVVSSKPRKP